MWHPHSRNLFYAIIDEVLGVVVCVGKVFLFFSFSFSPPPSLKPNMFIWMLWVSKNVPLPSLLFHSNWVPLNYIRVHDPKLGIELASNRNHWEIQCLSLSSPNLVPWLPPLGDVTKLYPSFWNFSPCYVYPNFGLRGSNWKSKWSCPPNIDVISIDENK